MMTPLRQPTGEFVGSFDPRLCDRPLFRSLPGEPQRDYFLLVPATARPGARVLVLVHGISENALVHVLRFAGLARRHGFVLVAPLFHKRVYGRYQQLVDQKHGARADLALLDILDAVGRDVTAAVDRVSLFGFSGGAQFAHRFAFVHSERVEACACASAGWYTLPEPQVRYPEGLERAPTAGRALVPDAIREIPFHVLVGDRDTARDSSLRTSEQLDATQGRDRLERAQRWFAAMQAWGASPASTFTLLPGVGHCFVNAVERAGLDELVVEKLGLARGADA